MTNDDLLKIAWNLNVDIKRQQREAEEEPTVPPWANPQLDDAARILQARLDRRRGRNRQEEAKAEAERVLIGHLNAVYGESP